jgi:hypothetical protein
VTLTKSISDNTATITASNGESATVTATVNVYGGRYRTVVSSGDSVSVRYNGAVINATFQSGGSSIYCYTSYGLTLT